MQLSSPKLDLLRDRILLLGGATEAAIARAIKALIERDADLATAVVEEDNEIDLLENQIDLECTEMLLSGAYSEAELRFILAVYETAPIIERIADHAVNIAKHAQVLINEPQLKPYIDLPRMAEVAQEMLLSSLDALTRQDCNLALSTIREDDLVDQYYKRIYSELIGIMQTNPKTVVRAVELLFVIKHLERIADYATNICEIVVYMAEGRVIKHTKEAM
ncbi:MAG: phosphate signaling complex protein PhoU [Acidobacteriota bacterium]|nr:phosphate signaling complex protein PhoU [Blastocatellia bacterium]MDW8412237.1 phosphate signaling complex protein PhoU [Acidobacteriota bacterium]